MHEPSLKRKAVYIGILIVLTTFNALTVALATVFPSWSWLIMGFQTASSILADFWLVVTCFCCIVNIDLGKHLVEELGKQKGRR